MQPKPLAPTKIGQYGDYLTNYSPMTETYADGVWRKVMHEIEKSLGLSGSIYSSSWTLALDLTDEGGLRALALLIPTDALI